MNRHLFLNYFEGPVNKGTWIATYSTVKQAMRTAIDHLSYSDDTRAATYEFLPERNCLRCADEIRELPAPSLINWEYSVPHDVWQDYDAHFSMQENNAN